MKGQVLLTSFPHSLCLECIKSGAPSAILDHEETLKIEAMHVRSKRQEVDLLMNE
jgi:hypothetical protein